MADDPVPAGGVGARRGRVLGRDPRLHGVRRRQRADRAGQHRLRQQRQRLVDLVAPPAAAVLVGEQHQRAVVVDPRVASRVLEQHQREQRDQRRLARSQREHDPDQPDRLPGQLGPQQVRARCRARSPL